MTNPSQSEIVDLERRYWNAMRSNDVEEAVALTKFPCTLTSPKGIQQVSEPEYRKMMKSMQGERFKGVEVQDPQVQVLNDDTAMIAYSIEMNGKRMLDVSTWVRDGDAWACAYHSENPLH